MHLFQAKGSYWWMVELQKQKRNSQNCQSPGRKMKESQRVAKQPIYIISESIAVVTADSSARMKENTKPFSQENQVESFAQH